MDIVESQAIRRPKIRLRRFRILDDPCTATMESALSLGGTVSGNEELVGKAVPAATPPREQRHLTESIPQENRAHTPGVEQIDGLYGYALILTRNRPEAEDLVQETYVRAIPAMGRLRADSNMKSWLFTILRNVWFNQLRSRRDRPQTVDIDGDSDVANSIAGNSDDPYDLYVSKIERKGVREAIQKFTPGHSRSKRISRKLRALLSEIPKRPDGFREV